MSTKSVEDMEIAAELAEVGFRIRMEKILLTLCVILVVTLFVIGQMN